MNNKREIFVIFLSDYFLIKNHVFDEDIQCFDVFISSNITFLVVISQGKMKCILNDDYIEEIDLPQSKFGEHFH